MNRRRGSAADRHWMAQALALGALAEGTTSPNPRVGCLLVRDGEVVGRGLHRASGRPHAEATALAEAGDRARGGTLYVTLEPCAHEGKTPPCADGLIRAGVARVVAAMQDPNPLVDGRGFDRLRRASIELDVGLLGAEAERLNAPFAKIHRCGLPLVTLKAALSVDGMIAARGGSARWISGKSSRRFAHRLRMRHDAVLVGAGTVRRDDPRLDVRLPGITAPRRRVVLAPTLDLDPGSHLFDGDPAAGPPPRVYTAGPAAGPRARALAGRAEIVEVSCVEGRLDLKEVLGDLARQGVQSVLVEGGARTFSSFLEAGLADEAALFIAGKLIGARGGTPLLDRESVEAPALAWSLRDPQQVGLESDLLLMGALEPPPPDAAGPEA